jgi:hypothetical protein
MTDQSTDDVHFDLRLDRQMFRELQAIAAQQRCGTGGVIRYYLGLELAKVKAQQDGANADV